jgi:hypothetical protein
LDRSPVDAIEAKPAVFGVKIDLKAVFAREQWRR